MRPGREKSPWLTSYGIKTRSAVFLTPDFGCCHAPGSCPACRDGAGRVRGYAAAAPCAAAASFCQSLLPRHLALVVRAERPLAAGRSEGTSSRCLRAAVHGAAVQRLDGGPYARLRRPFMGGREWGGTTPRSTIGDHLYLSGVTFFTLGYGDIVPRSGPARLLTILEAGTGLGFIAVVIGYLPVLYQLFSRREAAVIRLDGRAGSPPTALGLLQRHG